jgi:signal transduction histidine kinase
MPMSDVAKTTEQLLAEIAALRRTLDLYERDRKVTAYEIHDGLSQQLAGALMYFEACGQLGDRNSPEARDRFERAIGLLREGVNETRRLIGGLRPLVLEEAGFVEALEHLVREAQQRWGRPIELVHELRPARLAPPLETALYRIVQESLSNACRHSQSERIRVTLTERGGLIQLEVQDWGKGFDPEQVQPGHFGLRGMRERARLLGGRATIESAPGQGTRVLVELPAVEAAAEPPG